MYGGPAVSGREKNVFLKVARGLLGFYKTKKETIRSERVDQILKTEKRTQAAMLWQSLGSIQPVLKQLQKI